jgi:pimeloyl-ACP methyl ester carboxylesterase
MDVVERGHGTPLVIIPGIQGRWEYMRPAVDALARHFRVLTFSLPGERHSGWRHNRARGFDDFVDQIDAVLDAANLRAAIICGVSFGGLVALRFVARRPERASALVLVSTPGPRWHLKRRHEIYARLPWVFGPVFLAEMPWRMRDELRASFPDAADRRRFGRAQVRTFVEAPVSVSRMAARARLIAKADASRDCERIACPTLVVTGEPSLDHVIAVAGASPYASIIRHARSVVMPETGHLGLVTKPSVFAAHVKTFADEALRRDGARRPGGTAHDAA